MLLAGGLLGGGGSNSLLVGSCSGFVAGQVQIASRGMLGYPSYPIDVSIPHDRRLAHVWELRDR